MDSEINQILEGGCDTMCGASIGNLAYHRSVKEKFPHLVAQFECMADLMDQKEFGIGGIEGGGQKVTHIITYKTPFFVNGKQMYISLGLGDFGIQTLFSFPFLKKLKATIMLESGTVVSGLLGTAFKLTIKRPDTIGMAPSVSEGIPVALLAKAPLITQTLAVVSSDLTTAFKGLAINKEVAWREDPAEETTRS